MSTDFSFFQQKALVYCENPNYRRRISKFPRTFPSSVSTLSITLVVRSRVTTPAQSSHQSYIQILHISTLHLTSTLFFLKMCIALGYSLYKKSQAKKANNNNNPDEKDYAPKPHPVNAGPQTNYGPPSTGQPPKTNYSPDQRY